MKVNPAKEFAALERMTVGELQQRYVDVFGEAVRSRHKQYLIRRIAWRLQANAEVVEQIVEVVLSPPQRLAPA